MKQLALLALADAEVDLLTRFANRFDLTLSAVYHPDPHSLLARLAELADVPCIPTSRSWPSCRSIAAWAANAPRAAVDTLTRPSRSDGTQRAPVHPPRGRRSLTADLPSGRRRSRSRRDGRRDRGRGHGGADGRGRPVARTG
jgi:hypothetical protein